MSEQAALSFTLMKVALCTTYHARMAMRQWVTRSWRKRWACRRPNQCDRRFDQRGAPDCGPVYRPYQHRHLLCVGDAELLPKPMSACVIVMDNATFHKRQDIQTAIAHAGHTLEYLPPYSPDLNDIEPKWAQAKVIRRREGCSVEQLFAAYEF